MKTLVQILVVGLLLVSSIASAGSFLHYPVRINETWATGNILSARLSDDEQENIGCVVEYNNWPGEEETRLEGWCRADMSPDIHVKCYTDDEKLINMMGSISDFSHITFAWDEDEKGTCTFVHICSQAWHFTDKFADKNHKITDELD